MVADDPDHLTLEWHKAERGERIYVDVNRIAYAQHAVAPYAVRPRPQAPVAVPLHWDELSDKTLRPDRWTVADRRRAARGRRPVGRHEPPGAIAARDRLKRLTAQPRARRFRRRRLPVTCHGPGMKSSTRFTTHTISVAATSVQKPWMSKPLTIALGDHEHQHRDEEPGDPQREDRQRQRDQPQQRLQHRVQHPEHGRRQQQRPRVRTWSRR